MLPAQRRASTGPSVTTVWYSPFSPHPSAPWRSISATRLRIELAAEEFAIEYSVADNDDGRAEAMGPELLKEGASRPLPQGMYRNHSR